MIPLLLNARAESDRPFVTRLAGSAAGGSMDCDDARLVGADGNSAVYAGSFGLLELAGVPAEDLLGDVILVEPRAGRAERLIRAGSDHNSLLVTERCDQFARCARSRPRRPTSTVSMPLRKPACSRLKRR